jgi:hypothetical protein
VRASGAYESASKKRRRAWARHAERVRLPVPVTALYPVYMSTTRVPGDAPSTCEARVAAAVAREAVRDQILGEEGPDEAPLVRLLHLERGLVRLHDLRGGHQLHEPLR